jgi:hypothetical protein
MKKYLVECLEGYPLSTRFFNFEFIENFWNVVIKK